VDYPTVPPRGGGLNEYHHASADKATVTVLTRGKNACRLHALLLSSPLDGLTRSCGPLDVLARSVSRLSRYDERVGY